MSTNKPFHVPPIERHILNSERIGQDFVVQVMQPVQKRGAEALFPAVVVLDGNLTFDTLKSLSHAMQAVGQVERFVLIGIGYPGDNPFAGDVLRGRDLTYPGRKTVAGRPTASPIEGVHDIAPGKPSWQGAPAFLDFIERMVIPLARSRYPVSDRMILFGHSMAGGFGLYALLHSAAFTGFVLSSPSVRWGDHEHGLELLRGFATSGGDLSADVVLTAGSAEEHEPMFANLHFTSSVERLSVQMQKLHVRGLRTTCRIFADEMHATIWPRAFAFGVETLLGRPSRPPVPL